MMLLEAEHVSYKVGNKYLLEDINFRLDEGDNWVVVGLNGCGKTTLLSLLAGYLPFAEGKIVRQAKVGFVSDSFFSRYYRNETMDNVILSGYYDGLGYKGPLSDQQIMHARRLMQLFGISAKGRKPFSMLSKGERQKGLIARALVAHPQILLFDEAYSGLDVYAQSYMQEIMNYLISEFHISTVFVTHYFNEITDIYNKAMLIKNGRIHSQGNMADIVNTENISDFFNQRIEIFYDQTGMHLKMLNDQLFDRKVITEMFA